MDPWPSHYYKPCIIWQAVVTLNVSLCTESVEESNIFYCFHLFVCLKMCIIWFDHFALCMFGYDFSLFNFAYSSQLIVITILFIVQLVGMVSAWFCSFWLVLQAMNISLLIYVFKIELIQSLLGWRPYCKFIRITRFLFQTREQFTELNISWEAPFKNN